MSRPIRIQLGIDLRTNKVKITVDPNDKHPSGGARAWRNHSVEWLGDGSFDGRWWVGIKAPAGGYPNGKPFNKTTLTEEGAKGVKATALTAGRYEYWVVIEDGNGKAIFDDPIVVIDDTGGGNPSPVYQLLNQIQGEVEDLGDEVALRIEKMLDRVEEMRTTLREIVGDE